MSRYQRDYYDTRSSSSGMTDWLSDAVRNRPEAFLLMAAGAALMMTRGSGIGLSQMWQRGSNYRTGGRRSAAMSSGSSVRDRASSMASEAADRASGIGERMYSAAGDYTSDMRERVGGQVDSMREMASDYTDRATRYAQETGQALSERSGEYYDRARSTLQENVDWMLREQPLVLGALGLAAGAIIGAALPTTDVENRTLGSTRDQLADAATRAAQERFGRLKDAASEATDKVKEAVTSGDIDKMASTAKSVTEQIKGAAGASGSGQGSDQSANLAGAATTAGSGGSSSGSSGSSGVSTAGSSGSIGGTTSGSQGSSQGSSSSSGENQKSPTARSTAKST